LANEGNTMRKHPRIYLAFLVFAIVVVAGCPVVYFLTAYTKRTSHYISELTLDGENIYFGAGNCLYYLEAQKQILHELTCAKGHTFGQPAVDRERVYAQVGRFLVAVDLSARKLAWRTDQSGEPGFEYESTGRMLHYPGSTLRAGTTIITCRRQGLQFYNTQSGDFVWHTEPNWMENYRYLLTDNLVWYIVESVDERDYGSLKGLAVDTGETRYTVDLRPMVRFDELLAINAQWIFGAMDRGKNDRYIFAVNREHLDRVQWFSEISYQLGVSRPTIRDDLLIVRINENEVHALNINTGQVVWSFVPETYQSVSYELEHIVPFRLCERYDKIHNCRLYGLDIETGGVVWEYYLNAEPYGVTEPVISKRAVYIGNRDSVDVLDLKTGKLLQRVKVHSEYQFYVSKSGLD